MSQAELVSMSMFLLVFLGTGGTGFFFFLRACGDEKRIRGRLRSLSAGKEELDKEGGGKTLQALPRLGALVLPRREEYLGRLRKKFHQAGFYAPHSLKVFWGVKIALLIALPVFLALLPFALGYWSLQPAMVASTFASALGLFGPNFWLEYQIKKRQQVLRRGLPDALDMLVLCLEGGLSLPAAFQRITEELRAVHPLLGEEFGILLQTSQLGMSLGEAFKQFAERSGLEEARELATVLLQSESFGSSVSKALRLHADQFREERQRRAEETAQKAAVKILFPLLLFIFPAIFIVLVGPAAFQIAKMFSR